MSKAREKMGKKISAKKSSNRRSNAVQIDLDKSFREIDELLSEKYGSSPF